MMEVFPSDVDLTDLTGKQLAKEFKTVRKHIKSKDLDVRSIALQKVSDVRYFSIGGCLVPLIESIIPKKVTVDDTWQSKRIYLLLIDDSPSRNQS